MTYKKNTDSFQQFSDFIEKYLVPVLQSYLKEIDEYKFGFRLLRLFNFIVIKLHIGLNSFLDFMAEAIHDKPWITRIIFESYSMLFTNQSIINMILIDKESTSLLENCLATMQKCLEINKMNLDYQDKILSKPIPRFLETRMIETEKPDLKLEQIMVLSIETATGIVDVFSNLLFPKGLNSSISSKSSDFDDNSSSIVIPYSVSKFVLRILSILLEKSSRDISIQSILNSIQVYINLAGQKKMTKERDAFIREL